MTTFQRIPLDKLEINPANDRHGDVGSESSAIEWLLVNKTDKMRDLLEDIHERQGIVDEPLVMKKMEKINMLFMMVIGELHV